MDHEDVLEQLELAAVEPGGLERLAAGDTPEAAAVAGHLAGCPSCADELQRLSRAAPLLRDVVRTSPPAELRERTLAHVRERGRPRGPHAATAEGRSGAPSVAAIEAMPTGRAATRPRSRVLPWAAAIAAVVVVSIGVGAFVIRQADDTVSAQARAIAALERVTSATLELTARPDVRRVALTRTASAGVTTGSLLFSPSTMQLVVVAEGLEPPPTGREYRCWMEREGLRTNVGRMFFAGDLAFWIGDTPEVGDADAGTTFGVSLTEVGGTSLDADPVIVGGL